MEMLEGNLNAACGQLQRAENDYAFKRAKLGIDSEIEARRKDLHIKRAAALRRVSHHDIWDSQLPEDQKRELATEWEQYNVRSAKREAEAAVVKREPGKPSF